MCTTVCWGHQLESSSEEEEFGIVVDDKLSEPALCSHGQENQQYPELH